jgi:hypothetical protein
VVKPPRAKPRETPPKKLPFRDLPCPSVAHRRVSQASVTCHWWQLRVSKMLCPQKVNQPV